MFILIYKDRNINFRMMAWVEKYINNGGNLMSK